MFPSLPQPKQIAVRVLNALIHREDWAQQKIRQHAGKFVRLHIAQFQLDLAILPSGELALNMSESVPNVTLKMSEEGLRTLPALWKDGADMDAIASLMHVEGEAGLAQLVSELARYLRWDIAAELNSLVGPFMANVLISAFQKARVIGQDVGNKGLEKTKEFLAQDYHVIVQLPKLQGLREDIQQLSQTVQQLEQRIQKLQKV